MVTALASPPMAMVSTAKAIELFARRGTVVKKIEEGAILPAESKWGFSFVMDVSRVLSNPEMQHALCNAGKAPALTFSKFSANFFRMRHSARISSLLREGNLKEMRFSEFVGERLGACFEIGYLAQMLAERAGASLYSARGAIQYSFGSGAREAHEHVFNIEPFQMGGHRLIDASIPPLSISGHRMRDAHGGLIPFNTLMPLVAPAIYRGEGKYELGEPGSEFGGIELAEDFSCASDFRRYTLSTSDLAFSLSEL